MIRNGTKRHLFDPRDNSLHKTFHQFGAVLGDIPTLFYKYDSGLYPVPDQNNIDTRFQPNLPSLPYGCTGETATDICGAEDNAVYDPMYTYDMTCEIEGHPPIEGCDIRNSMKSLTIYGLRKNGETQEQAQARKRGRYFMIDLVPGRDWFDSFRLALRGNKRGISTGTPWFVEWTGIRVAPSGLLTSNFIYNGNPDAYPWHDTNVFGESTVDDEPVLLLKSWQGSLVGDNGILKWNRETFNKVFDIYGTIGATPGPSVTAADVQYVEATLWQQVWVFLNRLLAIIGMQQPIYA